MAEVTLEPFDIESLTLGELAAAQEASGLEASSLFGAYRLPLALFVQRLRNSGVAPKWQEIINLRLLDISSGPSPSPVVSRSPKSRKSA